MTELLPEKYRTDLEIIRLTAEQVIKDLDVFGITVEFSGNPYTAYEELEQQLCPILSELHKKDASSFMALLYRIDLSEKEFRKLSTGPDFISQLAAAVLQREFKKVIIRKYFSDLQSKDSS